MVALATGWHLTPHPEIYPVPVPVPQLLTSLAMWVSQPSLAVKLQSAYPPLQPVIVHFPAAQPDEAFGAEQALPQVPQLLGFVLPLVSQPQLQSCPWQFR